MTLADGNLPDKAAQTTKHAGNIQFDISFLSPDRQCMKSAKLAATTDNLPTLATRTSQRKRILFNGKDNCSIPILRADVLIAVNTETMVNILVDMLAPPLLVDGDHYKGNDMSTFLFKKYA